MWQCQLTNRDSIVAMAKEQHRMISDASYTSNHRCTSAPESIRTMKATLDFSRRTQNFVKSISKGFFCIDKHYCYQRTMIYGGMMRSAPESVNSTVIVTSYAKSLIPTRLLIRYTSSSCKKQKIVSFRYD